MFETCLLQYLKNDVYHRLLESRYVRHVKVRLFGHIDEGTEYTDRWISVLFRSRSMVIREIHHK
jgi:hypothetical protein